MENCLFCRILAGEIPAARIYQDENTLAFLDIHPRAPGHAVVIPRHHAATILDLPKQELEPLFSTVQKVALKIQEVLKPDGMNIGMNQGEASGQTVPHLHVHIMSRFKNDGGGSIHSILDNPPREELSVFADKLKIN